MAHRQFQSMFDVIFAGDISGTVGTGGAGSGTTSGFTTAVPGVKAGDMVLVFNYGLGAETAGAPVVGDVSAANTVRISVLNNSAGAVGGNYNAAVKYTIVVLRFQGK